MQPQNTMTPVMGPMCDNTLSMSRIKQNQCSLHFGHLFYYGHICKLFQVFLSPPKIVEATVGSYQCTMGTLCSIRRVHKLHRLFLCISSMQRSILTLQSQMGYRWNRLDPRNSKMLTDKSVTGSVRFYNRFSIFKILSLPFHLIYCTLILT